MQIVLFGTGAMACLFGARLAKVADVMLVGNWAEAIETIGRRGILLEDYAGTQTVRVQARSFDEPPIAADLVLVCVKAWQTGRAAAQLERYLLPEGVAVSLQNGIGNVERLGPRAFPGSTEEGATLLGPGHVRECGSGETCAAAPGWAIDLLRQAGFDSYGCSRDEADRLLWGKLCVSCGINALTGLLRIENGELLERPDACGLMIRAAEECAAVARAGGIELPFADPGERAREVARSTARNRSSMYQDLLRGAPTECDWINGAVVREARRLNMDAPVNDILWKLVRAAATTERIAGR